MFVCDCAQAVCVCVCFHVDVCFPVLTYSVLLSPVLRKPDTNIYDDPADINGEDGVYDRVEEIDPGTHSHIY